MSFLRHYHSFLHALDVTQTLFAILQFSEDQHVLMNVEKVVLLIAALGHDIHHPGVSNHYIVVSKHQHVLEYGDTSVLERMHVAKMKHLIEKHKIFESLEDREKIRMNRILTNAILNTDVAQHDKLLQNVEDLLQHNTFVTLEEEMMTVNMDEKDRELLCNFLLHSADLSNPAKPWPIAQKWAHLIMM
jgi:high affinity cGMP-specific 3',5'-cyclic phosphodiesterase 9